MTANVAILGWKFTKGATTIFPTIWIVFFYLLSVFGMLVVILTAVFPLPFIQIGFSLMAFGLVVLLVIWIMADLS